MPDVLNRELVLRAVNLAEPSIYALFGDSACVWGPRLVHIVVDGPGLDPIGLWVGDRDQPWDPKWGNQEDFAYIAAWKCDTALATGQPTSRLVHAHPLVLQRGDYLYPGGVVDETGLIGVGTSGIKGWADEMVSYTILHIMEGLAHLEVETMVKEGIDQVQ